MINFENGIEIDWSDNDNNINIVPVLYHIAPFFDNEPVTPSSIRYNETSINCNAIISLKEIIPYSLFFSTTLSIERLIMLKSNMMLMDVRNMVKSTFGIQTLKQLILSKQLRYFSVIRKNKPTIKFIIGEGFILTSDYEPIIYFGFNRNNPLVEEHFTNMLSDVEAMMWINIFKLPINYNNRINNYYSVYNSLSSFLSSSLSEEKLQKYKQRLKELKQKENLVFFINRKFINPEHYKGDYGYPTIIKKFIDSVINDNECNVKISKSLHLVPFAETVKNNKLTDFNKLIHSPAVTNYLDAQVHKTCTRIDAYIDMVKNFERPSLITTHVLNAIEVLS